MKAKLHDIFRVSEGEWMISYITRDDFVKQFYRLRDHLVDIEIKKSSPRSKTANDFMWALCTDIGNALRPPLPKEMVYKQAIRDVGEYVPLPIKAEAVETFQERWGLNGVGWFAEVIDDSKHPGYKLVFAYYGSSTYSAETMSRLIDYLKQDAENMGLKIPISKDEERRLLAKWERASSKAKKSAS